MKIYNYFFFLIPFVSFSQIGINTTSPTTTLDVNGAITNRQVNFAVVANAANINVETSLANITGTASAIVNVTCYVPTMNGHRLIIANNTTGGFGATFSGITIPNGQAIEFIYTNNLWKSTSGGVATFQNIYNTNGTLTSPRVVTQGSNSLSFTNNTVNAFNIDGTTFSVDGLNNQIGIGTITPSAKLDVVSNGATAATKALEINNSAATELVTILNNGNVGISQNNPTVPIQYGTALYIGKGGLNGNSLTGSDIAFSSDGVISSEGSFTMNIDADNNQTNSLFMISKDADTSSSVELMRVNENGNVGIGTTAPSQKLDVNGNIKMSANNTLYYQNLPDYRLVIREDFETVVTGWTDNTSTTVLGQNILGGYNVPSTPNQKTFDLTGILHTSVKIKFTYYSIDSWDTEMGFVKVLGTGGSWYKTFNYLDVFRDNIAGDPTFSDEIVYGEIELPHTANSITIVVDALLDSLPTTESYGIDNIEIWVK